MTTTASGSRCAFARGAGWTSTSPRSISISGSPRARRCAPRSARSSRPSACAATSPPRACILRTCSPTRTPLRAVAQRASGRVGGPRSSRRVRGVRDRADLLAPARRLAANPTLARRACGPLLAAPAGRSGRTPLPEARHRGRPLSARHGRGGAAPVPRPRVPSRRKRSGATTGSSWRRRNGTDAAATRRAYWPVARMWKASLPAGAPLEAVQTADERHPRRYARPPVVTGAAANGTPNRVHHTTTLRYAQRRVAAGMR